MVAVYKECFLFSLEYFHLIIIFCDTITDYLQVKKIFQGKKKVFFPYDVKNSTRRHKSRIYLHFYLTKLSYFQMWSLMIHGKTFFVGITLFLLKWFPSGIFYFVEYYQQTHLKELILEVVLYPIMITKYQWTKIWKPQEGENTKSNLMKLELLRGCLDTPLQFFIQTWLVFSGMVKDETLFWSTISLKDWHGNSISIPYLAPISIFFNIGKKCALNSYDQFTINTGCFYC